MFTGCGKTSFITALAGELEYSICVLNLSERGLSDDRLNHLMSIAPTQSIILLEDIDAAFTTRQETAVQKQAYDGLNRVTFSGLLNMLDGVASTEARILFMTTNYLDRLDPALIRPGRVDYKQLVDYTTPSQMKKAFINFYPDEDILADNFVNKVIEKGVPVSMAMLQGFFLRYKNNAKNAIDNTEKIWEK